MDEMTLSQEDEMFLTEKLTAAINAYQQMEIVDSMYYTYIMDGTRPVLEAVIVFDGNFSSPRSLMGEYYEPTNGVQNGSLFKLVMESKGYYSGDNVNETFLNALADSVVVFDKSGVLSEFIESAEKTSSSNDASVGPIKRMGRMYQNGC